METLATYHGSQVFKMLLIIVTLPLLFSFRPIPAFFRSNQVAGKETQKFILVKAMPPYTFEDFYVAKYEMKNIGGVPFSIAKGTPWTNISREDARYKCKSLGANYDIISNSQWQTIANDIINQNSNWSSGFKGDGFINSGHTDNTPSKLLEAGADDNLDSCIGTGQNCTADIFNQQRRTHKISDNQTIWDFSGNATEILSDNNNSLRGSNGYISTFNLNDYKQINFGTNLLCNNNLTSPFCGFGYGAVNYASGAIWRGGSFAETDKAGIFSTKLNISPLMTSSTASFRCIFTTQK